MFTKKFKLKNFQPAEIFETGQFKPKNEAQEIDGELMCEIFYTPIGWRVDVHLLSPLDIWDIEHVQKLFGIKANNLHDDLFEKTFDTASPAMQFITKRLKGLGWEPVDTWQ